MAKYELLKVPLIGWTWYFLEIVFCKRKWEEDRDTVFKGLTQLKDYPEFMWVSRTTNRQHNYLCPSPSDRPRVSVWSCTLGRVH